MLTTGKVQKNKNNVNVLVETNNSENKHISHLDKEVQIEKLDLTDMEIISIYNNSRTYEEELQLAKNWLIKQEGYAISNCRDESIDLEYNDIVKFTYKK